MPMLTPSMIRLVRTCCLLLLIRTPLCHSAITSSQTFLNLFDGEVVSATLLDDATQTLYVTSVPTGFPKTFFSLFKISSTGNRDYKVIIPFRDGRQTMDPTYLALHDSGNTLVLLANGGFSDPNINGGSDCTVYFIDASTGSITGDHVTLAGPEFVDSNGYTNTLLIADKAITSTADANKIFVMAGSLMDISSAAYGYSIFKIDVPSRSIDWTNHHLPSGSDGATPSDMLEVNASYLLVAGFLGLFRYDLSTGTRTDVLANTRINNLLHIAASNLVLAGAAGTDSSTALDATTLATQWTTPNGRGIVYHMPGPDANTVWFTRNLIPEDSENWDFEVGVIGLSDGRPLWSQSYDGGSGLFDVVVGFHSSLGTTAYVGASGRQATDMCLSNLFGLLPRALIGDAQVLTVDHSSQSINADQQVVDTSIGAPRVFRSSDILGWMISFDGSAIRYEYS
ncbi:expressed unknown protein [Seminavis robusta]|uniref:Uncharacterized protein n=1 Tax=Seminavis robusta TaxID=568900 RepID=A0A9N8ENY1_9STRA|nr:expressed unknown protein [Seminavis robusta]|eukprot:Sro1658_g289170.1 n/a (453) ;mRNA; f:16939-18297